MNKKIVKNILKGFAVLPVVLVPVIAVSCSTTKTTTDTTDTQLKQNVNQELAKIDTLITNDISTTEFPTSVTNENIANYIKIPNTVNGVSFKLNIVNSTADDVNGNITVEIKAFSNTNESIFSSKTIVISSGFKKLADDYKICR